MAALEEARRLGASDAAFYCDRATALTLLGDLGEALADFDRAAALDPDDWQTHTNRGFVRLLVGQWEGGWADNEWRLKRPDYPHKVYANLARQWQGEPLAGKTLLVCAEWGHGDTFQFIRYLRLIEDSGAKITLVVPAVSRRLLAANFPGVVVTESIGFQATFDYQVSLVSLPAIFGTTPETVPGTGPYLTADPDRVAKWGRRLGGPGFRVGIIWQGSLNYERDRYRSISLADYAPLAAVPGVRLISIQAMIGLEQLDVLPPGMAVERLGEEIENNPDGFREMAAAMANLDLLIMSDTGPTHLAAALGRPVWLAAPRYADWRWMRGREDSPWYPTMRLFWQKTAGDSAPVFARMARELAGVVARRGDSRDGPRPSPG